MQVTIEVPKKVTGEEETLLRQLAELEHKNVAPARKSFFEKLKDYFSPDEEEESDDARVVLVLERVEDSSFWNEWLKNGGIDLVVQHQEMTPLSSKEDSHTPL